MPMPQITWDDVQQLPDDGNRYEAIEGALYMTVAPSVHHQADPRDLDHGRCRWRRPRSPVISQPAGSVAGQGP